ncbi:MAG TPA: 50S ribosomal protein L25 [Blattabacteriaceae bacterium]
MNTIIIQVENRKNLGKKARKILLNYGKIPCVLYGGKENILFSVQSELFKKLIYPSIVFLEFLEEKKKIRSILKEIQFHPVSDTILHADFSKLLEGQKIELEVPIKIIGRSLGIGKGGKITIFLKNLKIRALPEKMPNYIELDITDLDIGDSLRVKEILTKYKILNDYESVILTIK